MELLDQQDRIQNGDEEEACCALEEIAHFLHEKPFTPHSLFTSGHAQTLAAYAWPRRRSLRKMDAYEARLFEVEPGVRMLAHSSWQKNPKESPTLLLMHGLEGSSQSVYMIGTALKAFRAGFNIVRLNQRTCGGTEHLTPTLYDSGMSRDVRAVVRELIERDELKRIFVCGFSMSGNIVLKYAGEEAGSLPREISGVIAVSPSVDLFASANAIKRRENWIYHKSFMIDLRSRMRRKKRLFPDIYDTRGLSSIRTMRQFDERFTAQHGGYSNADDYYARASALPLIKRIRTPTLIIHAQDDPFIPYEPLKNRAVTENPYVITLAPRHGGHVGFISNETDAEDRFWAENRIVEFCRLIEETRRRRDTETRRKEQTKRN
ncbi:MAG: hypothetical protein AUG51_21150 [Acidobacteria bacterium 13_1_20CM_3_53_8]|nr:MAG: hypothetical protein AUG51_21150 [Acidobacteria bacterium 13_1_20CM_3_53_8]